MVITRNLHFQSQGRGDIIDVTAEVEKHLAGTNLDSGIVTVFISGSTAGVTTIEYEPGLMADFKRLWAQIVPDNIPYEHDRRWGDGNGYSHIRASLLGASLVVPFNNRKLDLGTWQQIVAVDFDNRPRSRQVILQFVGE